MKKYLKILLFLNAFLVGVLCFFPYSMERTYFSVDHIKSFYKKNKNEKINILFLGDSTVAFGIRPKLIQNSFSLALPSSTNISIWLELNRFLESNPAPRCIVYSTSYIKEHFQAGFLGKHSSAGLYDWKEIKSVYAESLAGGVLPAREMGEMTYFLNMLYLKFVDFTSYTQMNIKRALFPFLSGVKEYEQNLERVKEEKGYLHSVRSKNNFMGERQQYLTKEFSAFETDDYYFKKILTKLQEKGIRFINLEMPILNLEKDLRVETFKEKHRIHVRSLINNLSNTVMLEVDFPNDKKYFFDANHLNIKGATVFSTKISEALLRECSL